MRPKWNSRRAGHCSNQPTASSDSGPREGDAELVTKPRIHSQRPISQEQNLPTVPSAVSALRREELLTRRPMQSGEKGRAGEAGRSLRPTPVQLSLVLFFEKDVVSSVVTKLTTVSDKTVYVKRSRTADRMETGRVAGPSGREPPTSALPRVSRRLSSCRRQRLPCPTTPRFRRIPDFCSGEQVSTGVQVTPGTGRAPPVPDTTAVGPGVSVRVENALFLRALLPSQENRVHARRAFPPHDTPRSDLQLRH